MNGTIGVSVCCCNRLLRESIARILAKRPDFQVAIVPPVDSCLPKEASAPPTDIIVIDSLPVFLATSSQMFRAQSNDRPVRGMLVAMQEDHKQFLAAIRHGALGYVLQDASATEVVTGIRTVARGSAVCPPKMMRFLFDWVALQQGKLRNGRTGVAPHLTRRELVLVPLIRQGLTNKEIAAQLHVSEETVKSHIHRMLRKVGVEDRRSVFEACHGATGI